MKAVFFWDGLDLGGLEVEGEVEVGEGMLDDRMAG